jgi:Rrf2 family protein
MQSVLQISRKVDYALRATIYLARLPDHQPISFKEIARSEDIPKDFLAKILRALVDAGIVNSTRGQHGGFSLARPPAEVSFLDVIEAVEGPVLLNVCLDANAPSCSRSAHCAMRDVWMLGQSKMLEVFRATTLAALTHRATPTLTAPPPVDAPVGQAL